MSNTSVEASLAVELWWRGRGITECILAEERIAIRKARDRFWGRR